MKLLIIMIFVSIQSLSNLAYANKKGVDGETIKVAQLARFPLGLQVDKMAGFEMRARRFIVPAGKSIESHRHRTTPGIVIVESGSIVEYRGDKSRIMVAGDTLIEDVTTLHSYRNTSNQTCVLIAIDLPKIKTMK